MRVGLLRHKVTIQQGTEAQDASGQPITTWSTLAKVWASVEPLSGREFFGAQQTTAELTTRIRIRYRDDVTPKMRITWNGHTYDIETVIDRGGRQRELELMCREVVSG